METTIHYYYYNLDKEADRKEYSALCDALLRRGSKLFDSISADHYTYYRDKIKPLDGQTVTLEPKHLFDNQWNTAPTSTSESGLRVFDWAEGILPNRNIKQGQWLGLTPKMVAIRKNTLKCGYCGKQYQAQQGYVFCGACLDSEYLEEKELHLLRLMPICETWDNRAKLTQAERGWLVPQYVKAQTEGLTARGKARIKKKYSDIKKHRDKTIQNANREYDGFKWLMDRGVNTDNCIYYDHTGRFCFGWRKLVEGDTRIALLEKLSDFPFDYDIK
ncbi:hypothetical protein [Neptuniibacter sp.]|uniref:hypothetical protein n=1 Tax=Neptuniibacter sp. TaxID=1962643 RepID=UPI0026196E3C|nr:hypothetical protein [Neptuniibacter sp.]MCP4597021.1 hypothetical protein [Neptuniibacter sp.]